MSEPRALPRAAPLFKQRSWSPETLRDETWSRRKSHHKLRRNRRCNSVTDDDLDELRACFELGFRFDSADPKLTDAFPALELYHTINKQYNQTLSRSSSAASTVVSDSDSSIGSPCPIFDSGDDPEMVKARLRQWAQVVACAVRQSSPN
ncbi:POU domain, class 6, transcription factor 2 like [Actinidia chinensis var. chinensis]|uniref:POU domain, class 6, transcription factor 2 like n=1 Tax=Actinidia chinensis var. chinensis TaxID=1590841 RepID=A0A2R6Q613_ACTCC|nr:POU domain, class 6, transcription factor 2 like [Actinidia chinensis var. chinensis]